MTVPSVTLQDGNSMPVLGLGTGEADLDRMEAAALTALDAGYRLIDTAAVYGSEEAIGRAIAKSGVPREELFVTTKVANADQGFGSTVAAYDASLRRLGLDYVDLYLIHWPMPTEGKTVDTWGALIKLQQEERVKSIGVCNFSPAHLSMITGLSYVTPVVNQIELHPKLNQEALRAYDESRGIVTEAYSPLGVGALTENPATAAIAQAHGKSPAQVLLRWSLQLGNVVIPKSTTPERIRANIDVFDFELTDGEMATLNGLDDGTRYRPDPETYTGI